MPAAYYPCWISPGRKAGGWSWGEPCDTPAYAAQIVKDRMDAGATLGVVVKMQDGVKEPMMTYIWPTSCRRVIEHWEQLWELTEEPKP